MYVMACECRGRTMSLMPDFELGLWNAWIFLLIAIIITVGAVVFIVLKNRAALSTMATPIVNT